MKIELVTLYPIINNKRKNKNIIIFVRLFVFATKYLMLPMAYLITQGIIHANNGMDIINVIVCVLEST